MSIQSHCTPRSSVFASEHEVFAVREQKEKSDFQVVIERAIEISCDTFGQSYWQRRERFMGLLEWLAALGNAEGMAEWHEDSEAARILAGRLRNDQA